MTPDLDCTVLVPVSFGELVDKISILRIKSERIPNPEKLGNVRTELQLLETARLGCLIGNSDIDELEKALRDVNERLWHVEERIRDCEGRADFGPAFVELARAVYKANDVRAALKRRINEVSGSPLIEEKHY
jgi:hypothetical protein